MATSEDSPVAMKLKKMWLKTPVGEEQAAQAVLDPALGKCPLCVRQSSQDKSLDPTPKLRVLSPDDHGDDEVIAEQLLAIKFTDLVVVFFVILFCLLDNDFVEPELTRRLPRVSFFIFFAASFGPSSIVYNYMCAFDSSL